MTKTFSKVIAVVLSLCLVFAVPVMASAEGEKVALSGGKLIAAVGDWSIDYVDYVEIEVSGDVWDFAGDTILTVGAGEAADDIATVEVNGATYSFTADGTFTVKVPLDITVDHSETYNFCFVDGAFVNEENIASEEYTFSVSGNAIIETLEVEHVSTKPIEKLIDWMYSWGAEGFGLEVINFIVKILNWFLYI